MKGLTAACRIAELSIIADSDQMLNSALRHAAALVSAPPTQQCAQQCITWAHTHTHRYNTWSVVVCCCVRNDVEGSGL